MVRSLSALSPAPSSLGVVANDARKAKLQPSHTNLDWHIDIPVLAPEVQSTYRPLNEVPINYSGQQLFELDEIIGEHEIDHVLYYYARWKQGFASRFPAEGLREQLPEVVASYLKRKGRGEFEDFDPSGKDVHPTSRLRKEVTVNKRKSSTAYCMISGSSSRSKLNEVSSEEIEDSDDEYEQSLRPPRRILRTRAAKALPFSPRKTRAQDITRDSSIDNDWKSEESEEDQPKRRSTRTRKTRGFDTANYEDSDGMDVDSGSEAPRSSRLKKPKLRKASRPAYGSFRSVEDLDYDPCSDEETAPLRKHRDFCEKCHRQPAHILLNNLKRKKTKGKRKRQDDDLEEESGDEEEKLTHLGGWVRCLKCPISVHWRCLSSAQRDEILKAARERDREEWRSTQIHDDVYDKDGQPKSHPDEPKKKPGLEPQQTTEFICSSCMKGGICMGCMDTALEADPSLNKQTLEGAQAQDSKPVVDEDVTMEDVPKVATKPADQGISDRLLFRCVLCKRLAHYEHLARPPDLDADASVVEVATWLQDEHWRCADCLSFQDKVEHVLAWRPYPPNAVEPPRPSDEPPNAKASLPREYLVKWVDRSYKRVQWVPHMWLASTHFSKLKNFLAGGTKVDLLQEPLGVGKTVEEAQKVDGPSALKTPEESRASSSKPGTEQHTSSPGYLVNAEQYIPPLWSTVDRVLDLVIWSPMYLRHAQKSKAKKSRRRLVKSGDEDDEDAGMNGEENEESLAVFNEVFKHGNNPPEKDSETLEEWEERTGQTFSMDDIKRVVFGFFKWSDLGYDDATWDSPPRPEDASWSAFVNAVKRFIASRTVFIKKGTKSVLDRNGKGWEHNGYMKHHRDVVKTLDIGQDLSLKLMDFQQDGFNWLCSNWWNGQHCILADEMGLGKTVQIASFLGHIVDKFDASPALVVVPNSTLPNWVREFERWAPNLRVVPWYGEARARDVIKKYELFHKDVNTSRYTDAKFHVLVTTYEAVISPKDFGPIFKKQPRWEVLIVDEGQRLKSDASLLFRKLTELNTIHRIIMTGTPLNNNIRELFNLMNFLDPIEWNDLGALEKEYAELTDELVKELHTKLRPYFLRRIKSEVLELPPKNEVIVPVSMTPLQKEIYRSILGHNLDILKGLTVNGPSAAVSAKKSRLTNLLMEMRKCLQHPYIYASDIEPTNLTPQATHEKLIDASAKFRLLKQLLQKLKARGHRILLFSQFVIALDVIEDFVVGEGYKCLRLDGNTKSRDRQKNMDEFNKPDSEYFIFLLSTRAGGVGINLYSADTVIIFDPDFNPHQDLQAIARSHRFGQQKTVLVFKLMVKDSAEERIMQMGKKKLALEHLIVKKMEDDDSAGEDIHSILTYGAKALFDDSEGASKDVTYSDADIDKLIERTEKETQVVEKKPEGGFSFEFAKIWSADKDSLEEVQETDGNDNSWSLTLQKIAAEQASARVAEKASGRGVRRKATNVAGPDAYRENPPTPVKSKKKTSKNLSDGSDYGAEISSASSTSSSSDDDEIETTYEEPKKTEGKKRKAKTRSPGPSISQPQYVPYAAGEVCSLCHTNHAGNGGECEMTRNSQDLVAFRLALMTDDDDDDIEVRRAAIKAIDETLARRGDVHLLYGQPLALLDKQPARHSAANSSSTSHHHPVVPTIHYAANALAAAVAPPIPTHHSSVFPSTSQIVMHKPELSRPKPKKHMKPFQCPVCDQQTYHLVKDCPVVNLGSRRIAVEIARLDEDPTKAGVVDILRTIYARSVKSEKALGNPST